MSNVRFQMARLVASMLSILVGIATWMLLFIVAKDGLSHMGTSGSAEHVIYFTPIALFGIPAVFVAFAKGGPALGFFALAAVPLLAPLNLFLSIAISSELSVDQSLSTFIAGFIWAALSALLIWITATSRSRGET